MLKMNGFRDARVRSLAGKESDSGDLAIYPAV
jgi:hypothetical protein